MDLGNSNFAIRTVCYALNGKQYSEGTSKIALVVDMRSRLFFDEVNVILDNLESNQECSGAHTRGAPQ